MINTSLTRWCVLHAGTPANLERPPEALGLVCRCHGSTRARVTRSTPKTQSSRCVTCR